MISKKNLKGAKCKQIYVDKDVCYIKFTKKIKGYNVSNDQFHTVRNEWMILDLDKKGKVLGIELIGNKKCMKG